MEPNHDASRIELLQRTKSRTEFVLGTTKLNQYGGAWICPKEIDYAAKFFGDGNKISIKQFKKRLEELKIPIDESTLSELFGDRSEISTEELRELLEDNSIGDFDPIYESFRMIVDPQNNGFTTSEELKHFLEKFCPGMNKMDVKVLLETMAFSSDQEKAFLVQYRQMFEKNGLDSGPPEAAAQIEVEGDVEEET